MTKIRDAEDANYWSTTIRPAKSQGEIIEMLENFGSESVMVAQGLAGGKYAWVVRFQWNERNYRFIFTPLACKGETKVSSFGGKRRPHLKQARFQMGRIAVHFVKAILTAAEAHPHALFGFLELPGVASKPNGIPYVAAELDVEDLVSAVPLLPDLT